MKRYFIFLLACSAALVVSAQQSNCSQNKPFGFGKYATGGGNVASETVKNYNELKAALTSAEPKVVLVDGQIVYPENAEPIDVASNKTVIGLEGAKLQVYPIAQDKRRADGLGSGLMIIDKNERNIILRNLVFQGPGAWDTDAGRDLITNSGTNVWVDHCEFYDGMDGNFDNNHKSDSVTISWCKFGYTIAPKPMTIPDGTNDHRFSCLVSSNAKDAPADGKRNITFAYDWWSEGCKDRMPRARNAQLHILNCYYNSSVGGTAMGLEAGISGTDCYAEGNNFEHVSKIYGKYTTKLTPYGNNDPNLTTVDCISGHDGTPFFDKEGAGAPRPTYAYTAIPVGEVKSILTGKSGAGATLNVKKCGCITSGTCGECTICVNK